MKQHAVIFQYIDRPAKPDKILVDAIEPTVDDVSVQERDALPSVQIPDSISTDARPVVQKPTAARKRLSYAFRSMVGGGVLGLLVLFAPYLFTEASIRLNPPQPQAELPISDIEIVDEAVNGPTFTQLVNDKYIAKINPINTDYALVVPKLGINSAVAANVDPGNKQEYSDALKQGAAHAKGTALPNEQGSKFIFAHSTDTLWDINQSNAVFYLLKDLEPGDQILVVYKQKLYPYRVASTRLVDPGDTFFLKRNLNDDRLILQTCYPPGTVFQRMLVFAEPIDSILTQQTDISYNIDN